MTNNRGRPIKNKKSIKQKLSISSGNSIGSNQELNDTGDNNVWNTPSLQDNADYLEPVGPKKQSVWIHLKDKSIVHYIQQ